MASTVTVEVEVDVDVENVLPEIDTSDLIEELRDRDDLKQHFNEFTDEHYMILENLYYALRDKGIEDAIKVINPLLDEKLGKVVYRD